MDDLNVLQGPRRRFRVCFSPPVNSDAPRPREGRFWCFTGNRHWLSGGFVRHDDPIRSEVQLAKRLRKEFASEAIIETFENHNGDKAHQKILTVLGVDHDGTLSPTERKNARIILYGHSWGGAEVIIEARRSGERRHSSAPHDSSG